MLSQILYSFLKDSNKLYVPGTFIGNNTAVIDIFARLLDQYKKMYKKRAFAHWYYSEGMDEMEFTEVNEISDTLLLSTLTIYHMGLK